MSQNSWTTPGGENENNNRSTRENNNRERYEGFEGMNYEQARQPFRPERAGNQENNTSQREEGNAPNNP